MTNNFKIYFLLCFAFSFFLFFSLKMSESSPLLQQQQPKPPLSRPKNRRRRSSFDPTTYNSIGTIADTPSNTDVAREAGLSLTQILGLTICMAGVQFTCKFLPWSNCQNIKFLFV